MLRTWCARWGLPDELRVDNGPPWGSWSELPPELALWVLGLGIGMRWNRPRHSQANAVSERAHGVCQRWVEPATCQSPAEMQARLDWATRLQRERYPAIAGQSRLAAFPALATGGRPDDPGQEGTRWDERRVWAWLEARVWTRRVDKVGRISLANRALGVGRAWAGTEVTVRLVVTDHPDSADHAPAWIIHDAHGTLLRQHPAPELARERILARDVSHRPAHRQRSPRRARAKPSVHPGGEPYAR